MDDSMLKYKQIIEQQQIMITSLSQQINCTSNYGYSMINGSCVQVSCAISGQQNINGICQCTNINSIVVDGLCVCPFNSFVIGSACVCSISGQTIQNRQCACQTTGAFVNNNVCTCGENGINISNSCSCPSGANLVNGVCICSNINAYISGNQCVCPLYSSLVGNTCKCPSNSQIIDNECICNQISGQIMKNGLCICQTIDAYVNSDECVCGLNANNVSNTCTCPANSILINNICQCNKISGQYMVSGTCQCPFGQSVVYDQCQQTSHVINITNFECSQEVFAQSFDIQSITNQITDQSNFSSGYVFSALTAVENAFISVSDYIYTSSIYPLFQSQNIFKNIKLSFGTQIYINGSFLLSSSTQISINKMNIITKFGSQLTVNNLLNIISSLSTNANITNLLVNLSFAISSGNITLINNINGLFNIQGYQVLGMFITTKTVAMIGINIYAATIIVNQLHFQPSVFNVGNGSSYIFSVIKTTSTIIINNFAVILGNSSNFQLLSSIPTTNINIDYFTFGGIIAYITSNSTVNVNRAIFDSYQKLSTSYVSYSGFLVGNIQSSTSSVSIQNMCLQQSLTSTAKNFFYFGLIGWNSGNASISNTSINFEIQGADINFFGIIGFQYNSIYVEAINLSTQMNFNSNSGSYIGSVFGFESSQTCSIQNTYLVDSNISSNIYHVGGIIGSKYSELSNIQLTIQNSTISKTNISGYTNIGSFIGYCQQNMYLINSKIQFVRLSSSSYVGIVVGYNNGTYIFSGSSSTQNYINGIIQNNCAILSNTWSIVGC
ncbi:Conserved_hypothetical protein [Hexamita inflata]|uniref:Uncharacterized protein n=1 Tax=Hexamita inflata TaxID=28002 RepID=A0AA86TVD7_9EUKA|nr:Conserved hypothetical protein [Hexamita inflata]